MMLLCYFLPAFPDDATGEMPFKASCPRANNIAIADPQYNFNIWVHQFFQSIFVFTNHNTKFVL